jgi:fumarate hydratase subunit alpha
MRVIEASVITKKIKHLCNEAAIDLPSDVFQRLLEAKKNELYPLAKETLSVIIKNNELATKKRIPICQDTGMAFVYITIGQEIYIQGNLE